MSKKPASIISDSGRITVYWNKKPYNVENSHPNYTSIHKLLTQGGDYNQLTSWLDVGETIKQRVNQVYSASGNVEVRDGQVFYNGEAQHGVLVSKILEFVRNNYDFKPLVNFMKNLMDNPSKYSVDNLYRFLEHNSHPITEDGYFLAYKYVREDYKDCHSGKFDNTPGQVVKMPRNKVQDDPNILCSYGLHVGALSYVTNNGHKVVVVKVNPRDVVSVPTDYNNTKMRVCEYEVVSDYEREIKQEEMATPYMYTDGGHASVDVCDYENTSFSQGYADSDYDDDDDDDWDDDDSDLEDDDEFTPLEDDEDDDEEEADIEDWLNGYLTAEGFEKRWGYPPTDSPYYKR
jgi:hypothetical protein